MQYRGEYRIGLQYLGDKQKDIIQEKSI